MTYLNTNTGNPDTADRIISFQVDDGAGVNNLSNVLTATVTITAAPDAPEEYWHVRDAAPSDSIDPMELAATTAVVQLIMNFEEFQVKL